MREFYAHWSNIPKTFVHLAEVEIDGHQYEIDLQPTESGGYRVTADEEVFKWQERASA